MIRGVLFDLDGVIVDTLHYHYLAWKYMFEKEGGGTVSEHSVLLHEGRSSREILPILMKEAGIVIPEERQAAFIEEKRAYYRTIAQVKEYPGAFDVIGELRRRGFRTALVTACALKNMQHSLSSEKQGRFDFIITGDEVVRVLRVPRGRGRDGNRRHGAGGPLRRSRGAVRSRPRRVASPRPGNA